MRCTTHSRLCAGTRTAGVEVAPPPFTLCAVGWLAGDPAGASPVPL
jgi:hypothetical protein